MNEIAKPKDERDKERFAVLKSIIVQGMPTFISVGMAILEIREARLYRFDHANYEAFCRDCVGRSVDQSNRLAEVAKFARH